jgi:hypothetical protein
MSRAEFVQLRRGRRLQERSGRVWTVHAEPFGPTSLVQVVIRAGDLVRTVNERFSDDYMLLPPAIGASSGPPGSSQLE